MELISRPEYNYASVLAYSFALGVVTSILWFKNLRKRDFDINPYKSKDVIFGFWKLHLPYLIISPLIIVLSLRLGILESFITHNPWTYFTIGYFGISGIVYFKMFLGNLTRGEKG